MNVVQTEFSIASVRPDSSRLFFLFTGAGLRPAGAHTLDTIARTPLASQNIVLLRDLDQSSYEHGFGGDYASVEGMVRWQREQIAAHFPHVRELFCMGVSIGGLTAIQTACRLGARAAWSLAGRVIQPGVVAERIRVSAETYQRAIGRTRLSQLTSDEERALTRLFEQPEMRELRRRLTEDPETILARDRLRAIADDVRAHAGETACHLYCVETNAIDRECADAFRGCPNVTIHYVPPEQDRNDAPLGFAEPDHSIVSILNRRGEWATLFSPYL